MNMGVLLQNNELNPDPATSNTNGRIPSQEITIPKKKWIKDYLTYGEKSVINLTGNCRNSNGTISSPRDQNRSEYSASGAPCIRIVQNRLLHHASPNHLCQNHKPTPSNAEEPCSESLPEFVEDANGYRRFTYGVSSSHQSLRDSPDLTMNLYTSGTSLMSNSSVGPGSISSINLSHNNSNKSCGIREVHNKLEKNRRAHLKECFEFLQSQLPAFEDHGTNRKISNLAILRSSFRYIQNLKKMERDYEHEVDRLTREKIRLQERLSILKKDVTTETSRTSWDQSAIGRTGGLNLVHFNYRQRSPSLHTESTLTLSSNYRNRISESSSDASINASGSAAASIHKIFRNYKNETEDSHSESDWDSCIHPPLLLDSVAAVTNCHITEEKLCQNSVGQREFPTDTKKLKPSTSPSAASTRKNFLPAVRNLNSPHGSKLNNGFPSPPIVHPSSCPAPTLLLNGNIKLDIDVSQYYAYNSIGDRKICK